MWRSSAICNTAWNTPARLVVKACSELIQVEKEGAPISSEEMVVMVFLLLFAGHETTTHLISGSVFELAKNPGLRDWLAEDWGRADLAVEDFLRFVSSVQFSKPRLLSGRTWS